MYPVILLKTNPYAHVSIQYHENAENVRQSDLITSEPCCTTQDQPTYSVSMLYNVYYLGDGPEPKTLTMSLKRKM